MKSSALNPSSAALRASAGKSLLQGGRVVVLALATACCPAAWAEIPTWRLIDADPPSLPTSPTNSWTIGRWGAGINLATEVFPWIQDKALQKRLANEIDAAVAPVLKKVVANGQRGVLISHRIYYVVVDGTKYYGYQPTYVVGYGPNADAVCFSAACHQTLSAKMPDGAVSPDDDWYTWVEPTSSGKGYKVVRSYSWQLQNNAAKNWMDAKYAQAYKKAIYQEAMADYAVALAKSLPDKTDRSAVAGLVASRNKAIERRNAVETQLQEELRRAAKAAKANALLATLGQALQFGQIAMMASGMMGGEALPQTPATPLNTPADVSRALQKAEAAATASAAALAAERNQLIDSLKAIDNGIIQIGNKGGGDSGLYNPGLY